MYQPIVYYKGAKVLDMLRYVVGDDAFYNILRQYALDNYFQNVKLEDFIRACNENYPKSLDWFFDEWLYLDGAMKAEIDTVNIAKAGNSYEIKILISQDKDYFKMPIEIKLLGKSPLENRVFVDKQDYIWKTQSKNKPKRIILDEDNWILWGDRTKISKNLME